MNSSRVTYYFKIWWIMAKNSFLVMLGQKFLFLLFLSGKIFRFIFFIVFLFFLIQGTQSLAGYSLNQTLFFFLTFNLIDVLGQFLFREVYRFRPLIVSGDFDLVLTKPLNPLFRVLLGGADIIDLVTIPPLVLAVAWVGSTLNPGWEQIALYVLLVINGLLISSAFHVAVLALGIITFEIDHLIMIFRDIVNLGRLPVGIYRQPLQGVLTFLIPVGLMITLPAQALMGLFTTQAVIVAFMVGAVMIVLSFRFWNYALKFYTSASS